MFIYDRGLFLRQPRIGIDVARPLKAGFISHGHFDHMARHEIAYCTRETAAIYQYRLGKRPVRIMEMGVPIEIGDVRLTALPAGHVLGSAMLLIENGGQRILYTGDFQLVNSLTAQPADIPEVDLLIMECTFGRPDFQFPDRKEVTEQLVSTVRSILGRGQVPVIDAYVLGKAQEVTRILCDHGFSVYLYPEIYRISQIYEELGVRLGNFHLYENGRSPGGVVIKHPAHHRGEVLEPIHRAVRIGLSGWSLDATAKSKMAVDVAIPFSDHADYGQLMSAVKLSKPKRIFCMHGFKRFVHDLRALGHDAQFLTPDRAYCP